jgi:hypothetical protein
MSHSNIIIFGYRYRLMASEEKSHRTEWTIAIVTGVILAPIFTDLYNKTPIWTSAKWLWNKLILLLNFEVKIWVVLTILAMTALYFYVRYRKLIKRVADLSNRQYKTVTAIGLMSEPTNSEEDKENARLKKQEKMLAYTADKFLHITWEWAWIWNKKISRYEVKKLFPCCPNLDCELEPMMFESSLVGLQSYRCPNCQKIQRIIHNGISINQDVEDRIMKKVATF